MEIVIFVWFGLDCFYDTSTIVGYFILNLVYTYVLNICKYVCKWA